MTPILMYFEQGHMPITYKLIGLGSFSTFLIILLTLL
jgi:hypothetical protein